ncbi:hypothetical protein A5712_10065 [Mycobacterium sp. E2327]|uniref:hypothetical protein n=1 Tax=Mycobacterium sp. E2327 TaxID=1834132 RepID=UPI000802006E|nr:hypothetical protein [Mycobacterium sp. E2327]OBI11146.1 hypothetical protein A5712_10065 [Mycobacterium sp. E2327]
MSSAALDDLLTLAPFGADAGINTEGDALVQVLADGTDLNAIWSELRALLSTWNTERSAIAQLLAYDTTNTADAIPQSVSDESFEPASEFGEPTSIRVPSEYLLLGYTLEDYDRATRFTWKALRRMTAEQVRSSVDAVLAADNKLINGLIMKRLFDKTAQENEWGHTCYGLWNGDGVVPPAFAGKTFTADHTHYLSSGATTVDSGDLETAFDHIIEHGYAQDLPSQLLVFCHPNEEKAISKFRAGVQNNNNALASYDFVPSAAAAPYLLPIGQQIQGTPVAGNYNGLAVQGSYGPGLIIRSYYIPQGYLLVTAAAGPNHPANPVGLRHHDNAAYQGLRQIPGRVPAYPLQDSFFARAVGTGVRHRGAAVALKLGTGSYTAPTIPV